MDKEVTLTGAALSGTDATNYSLTSVATATASITPRDTIIGSFTVAGQDLRRHDRRDDHRSLARRNRRPATTSASPAAAATFDDKNVGLDKTVTGTGFTLSGTDAGNYTRRPSRTPHADIDAKDDHRQLHGGRQDLRRQHERHGDDRERALHGNGVGRRRQPPGGSAGTFDTERGRGTGKDVSITRHHAADGGNLAGNYDLTSVTATTTPTSPPRRSRRRASRRTNKTYDGNADATVTTGSRALSGTVSGDDAASPAATATFDNRNVAVARRSPSAGVTLSGTASWPATTTSPRSPRPRRPTSPPRTITGSFTADDKIYDGNTDATVSTGRSPHRGVAGDAVTLTGGDRDVRRPQRRHRQDRDAHRRHAVAGADASNYNAHHRHATTTADITAEGAHRQLHRRRTRSTTATTDATVTGRSLPGVIGDR